MFGPSQHSSLECPVKQLISMTHDWQGAEASLTSHVYGNQPVSGFERLLKPCHLPGL
jgi:hypothetical protein